ncbi:MAG: hypothetical protein ACM3KR_07375 [Deltaproteobacteria bacterium]
MSLLCQVPYNFSYDEGIMDYLYSYKDIIESVYAGFSKGSRPIKNDNKTITQHLKRLCEIKEALDVRIIYVMNSVIPTDLDDIDKTFLTSGIVDCINLARDDIFEEVYGFAQKNKLKFSYEVSRFYDLIQDNNDILKKSADYILFGFKHEIEAFQSVRSKFPAFKIGYIANENCFPFCDKKLDHNRNVILRNLGKEKKKFSCPYKEYRKLYTTEEITDICDKNNIDFLKICDRTMTDEELLNVLLKWIPIVETINKNKNLINV